MLADSVLSNLPAHIAAAIPDVAGRHAQVIEETLAQLVQSDPVTGALVARLGQIEQGAGSQRISVNGNHNVVVTAGRDIRGVNIHALPDTRPQKDAQAAAVGAKGQEANSLLESRRLRQILAGRLDDGELRTLCFDLGIDYDDLPGEGKANKARELIAYLERRGLVPELVRVGRQMRPDIPWNASPDVS